MGHGNTDVCLLAVDSTSIVLPLDTYIPLSTDSSAQKRLLKA